MLFQSAEKIARADPANKIVETTPEVSIMAKATENREEMLSWTTK